MKNACYNAGWLKIVGYVKSKRVNQHATRIPLYEGSFEEPEVPYDVL